MFNSGQHLKWPFGSVSRVLCTLKDWQAHTAHSWAVVNGCAQELGAGGVQYCGRGRSILEDGHYCGMKEQGLLKYRHC